MEGQLVRVTELSPIIVKVYNPLKQELIGVFENYSKAARALGLTPKIVYNKATSKKRVMSPYLEIEVAIRITRKKPEDKFFMSEIFKRIL